MRDVGCLWIASSIFSVTFADLSPMSRGTTCQLLSIVSAGIINGFVEVHCIPLCSSSFGLSNSLLLRNCLMRDLHVVPFTVDDNLL